MQFISTKYHAVLDYIIGVAMMSTPWLFYNWDHSTQMWLLFIAGISQLGYSLITRYEYSFLKIISVRFHLSLDMLLGIGLIISPWMFNFHYETFMPFICFGILQIAVVAFSSTTRAHQLYTGPYHHKF